MRLQSDSTRGCSILEAWPGLKQLLLRWSLYVDDESVLAQAEGLSFSPQGPVHRNIWLPSCLSVVSPRASDPRGSKVNTHLASGATPLLIVQAGPIQCERELHRKWESLETILDIDYHRIFFQLFKPHI